MTWNLTKKLISVLKISVTWINNSKLWKCLSQVSYTGDRVQMVSKCIMGLFWGTHFQHGGKFVPQSSPTMYFNNHLDRFSNATSNSWILVVKKLLFLPSKMPHRLGASKVSPKEWYAWYFHPYLDVKICITNYKISFPC